jgi:hypothetical protein
MQSIDNLGKIYYWTLKRNRLVDDSGGEKKYKRIEELEWNQSEQKNGKIIKIKTFTKTQKVKELICNFLSIKNVIYSK